MKQLDLSLFPRIHFERTIQRLCGYSIAAIDAHQIVPESEKMEAYRTEWERYAKGGRSRAACARRAPDGTFLPGRRTFAPLLAVILLALILVSFTRPSRAEPWCGDGPGTALSHPCTDDDDNQALDDAIAKYRDEWMRLKGVWSVEEGDDENHNRVANIEVRVESASVISVRKQIPSAVDGIPVVILPGEIPSGVSIGSFTRRGSDDGEAVRSPSEVAKEAAEEARRVRLEEDRKKAEDLYSSVVLKYGYHWMDLPGVTGMTPANCNRDGCDFTTVGVTVQRELLPETRREIPSSVDGERIELIPED